MAIFATVKTIAAGKFKDVCLKTLDEVAKTRTPLVITKRGRPVAKKVEKGQLVLDRPLDQWLDQATAISGMLVSDLTRHILVDSCRLPQPFQGDPADQIIVATARQQGAILVTKDRQLRNYPHVRSVW